MKAADKAATTIQANFRGYRVRKQLRTTSKKNGPRRSSGNLCTSHSRTSQASSVRPGTPPDSTAAVPQPVTTEKNGRSEQNTNKKEEAAIKIQAGVRGYLVRKRKESENKAATKIQAGYRAFREKKKAPKEPFVPEADKV